MQSIGQYDAQLQMFCEPAREPDVAKKLSQVGTDPAAPARWEVSDGSAEEATRAVAADLAAIR